MKTHLKFLTQAIASIALAMTPAKAATVSASSTAPVIDGFDIANYGDVTGNEKWGGGTGVEGPPRGQSFTTGGAAVRLKSITYQLADVGGGAPTKIYALRVGKVAGNNFTQVHSETATQSFSFSNSQYVTWTFSSPVILEPYTIYGIDLGITSDTADYRLGIPYINVTANEYPGGTSFTSGTNGIGGNFLNISINTDRIFHLDLEAPLGPVFSLVAPSPPDNATDALATRALVLTFSQNVTAGTGNLTIKNLTDGIDTPLAANDSRLTYDQNVVRINPIGLLNWSKNYAIRMDAGVFLGTGAAPIPAITDDTTWNFTTLANDPLLAAIAALKGHINGSAPLSGPSIAGHKSTIDNMRQRFPETAQIIAAVLDLISTYDAIKGPLFLSTSNAAYFGRSITAPGQFYSISPENYHWVIYTVMQHTMDWIYTGEVLAEHEALLANYKFGSHTNFPGPCSPPANPLNTHTVAINGSFPATFGRLTQDWTKPGRKPTGTYLAPGTIVTVTVPPSLVNAGYKIRVCAHSWDLSAREPVLRLERASRLYNIDAAETKIASPYGGGIYIEVPYLASAGVVNVTITGAVRAPYFSAKSFHQTTPTEWLTEKTHPAPWADFQSEKFMTQVPRKWIYNHPNPTQLMVDWDKGMDAINDLMGFPRDRGKETMYCQPDVILRSSVHAPGYPAVNVITNPNNEVTPAGNAGNYLVSGPGNNPVAAHVEFHEQGHAFGFPKFGGESESTVNFLHASMLNRGFGYSHDVAHASSLGNGSPFYTIDNTAVAWMAVFNFSPREVEMAQGEKAYQHKGHAKFADIARMFGWTGIDNYFKSFMQDDENNIPYIVDTDELLLRLSRHVGKDVRPLFHFWGIFPKNPTTLANALAAENIPSSPEIKAQLLRYKTLVPANNAAFRSFCTGWWGGQPSINGYWEQREHARQWDTTSLYGVGDQQRGGLGIDGFPSNPGEIYNENSAKDIRNRVQELVDLYYPVPITPSAMSFVIAPSNLDLTTVSMTAATATAGVSPIEYYFENITTSTNSGWITTPTWSQTGLTTGTSYTFRVKARDGSGNETAWSTIASVTAGQDLTPPAPNPMGFATAPFAPNQTSISMTATTVTDINGVEYYFDCTAGGGNDSGWQDSPTYTDTGLPTAVSFSYRVQARDKSPAQNATSFSAVASAITTDIILPTLVSFDPANASSGILKTSNLTATFSEPIIRGSGFITLKNLSDLTQTQISITDLAQISITGSLLTIDPTADLIEGKTYAIRIDSTAIDDISANSYSGITNDSTWSFSVADPTPPALVSFNPADDSTTAPSNGNLVITFSETVTPGTGNIIIKNLTDATQSTIAITDATQVIFAGAVLTINPAADLLIGKNYAIQLATTAISDPATNPFPGITDDTTWNFTTIAPLNTAFWLGTSGNWSTPATWLNGNIASGTDFTASFTGIDITANQTITLDSARTVGHIVFTDLTTASHNLTISGANTLTLDRTTGAPSIEVTQTGRNLTISSVIAGTDGLVKNGPGTLTLKGTNTFSGGLTIKAGSVGSDNTGSGGNFLGSGTVTIGDNANSGLAANLNFNGSNFTSTNPISVIGNGAASISVGGWSQTLNGAITLNNNLTVTTNNPFGSSLTFGGSGSISGSGNLIIQSNAANNANTSSIITLSGSGGINISGSITNSGSGSSSGTGNVNTTISNIIGTNVTGVTQSSTNSALILSGANTFAGNIQISAGTLSANRTTSGTNPTASALGNTQTVGKTATISSGGTLNFNLTDVMGNGGSSPILTLVANGGVIKNTGATFNSLGPVQLNGGTLSSVGGVSASFPSFALKGPITIGGTTVSTISNSGANSQMGLEGGAGSTFNVADATTGSDLNVSAVLANWNGNSGILVKTGAGTMTLSAANTYTGATTVNDGTLAVTGSLGATAVTVNSPATLAGNGNIGGNVTVNSGARHALAVAATPAAQVTRAITGTLTLTSGNILDLTATAPPAVGVYVLATATTAITGAPTTTNSNVINGVISVDTASTPKRLLLTVSIGNTYTSWIAGYPGAASMPGFTQDADNDGIENGIENFFGTNPTTATTGLLPGVKSGNTFTFTHPQNASTASNITATYRWSKNLATFHDNGASDGTTTVTFTTATNAGITTVTATITGTASEKIFADVKVLQN